MKQTQTEGRWYREPWPWILFGLPASAVIAGVITLVIAVKNEDGLVAQDYYKQGLSINRVLERESRAKALGLTAQVSFAGELVRVRITGDVSLPPTLNLHFVHPTRAGSDRVLVMARVPDGAYQAHTPALGSGQWLVQLEDGEGKWRLSNSHWHVGETLTLGAARDRSGEGRS